MNEQGLYRRIARRETHQSRSTASVIVLAVVALGAVYVGVEIVLALVGLSPLLVSPVAAVAAYTSASGWLPVAGAFAVAFGVILLLVALIPTRRARHSASHPRIAIVIDDGVLAGALARESRMAVGIGANRVRATVSRSKAVVTLTPTSGVPIDRAAAQTAADQLLATLNTSPPVRARVVVAVHGVVGS